MSDLAVAPQKQENLTENQKKFFAFLNRGKPPCDHERQLMEKHENRIKAIFQGKIVPPYEVEIQPSSSCNLNCSYCFGKALTSKKLENNLGKEEIDVIAKRIADFKENGFEIEIIKFCGTTGEPLLNPIMLYGIELFKGLGKKIIVFTNGLWLDKKFQNKDYVDYILEADSLRLSLDAASEETFRELKGKDGFERIINNLKTLIEKREQQGSNLNITIGYVIGRENYHEIAKAIKLMKGVGADEIRFRVDFTDVEGIHELYDLITQELNKAKEYKDKKFKIISEYSKKEIGKDDSMFHSCGRVCFNQHFWACIGPDCNLYACGHRTYYEVEPYGSLLEHSFRELWLSKGRLENLNNLPDKHCKFCSPSSTRRNEFITFLYNLKFNKLSELPKFSF